MPHSWKRFLWMGLLLSGVTGMAASLPANTPRLWIWAWDRPENLRFLKPGEAGIAYYALGLRVEQGKLQVRVRKAPLRLPEGVPLIAVVRIDAPDAAISEDLLKPTVEAIRHNAVQPGILELQIDFDATRSQRVFYRKLLRELQQQVSMPLSITALASWCMGDPWIQDLPVSEVVPMLFQMGADTGNALAWLREKRALKLPKGATLSLGLATNQPLPVRPASARVFVFHARPWSKAVFDDVRRKVSP